MKNKMKIISKILSKYKKIIRAINQKLVKEDLRTIVNLKQLNQFLYEMILLRHRIFISKFLKLI